MKIEEKWVNKEHTYTGILILLLNKVHCFAAHFLTVCW